MYIEATVKITGITALQQSREYGSVEQKQKSETHDAYEKRCWKLRAHTNPDGKIYHPGAAFKQSIVKSAQYLGTQIQGQGKKTYTQKFQSGLTVVDNLETGTHIDNAEQRAVFASSTGKTGQGGRVWKYFPTLPKWSGILTFHIYDPIITKEVFMEHIDAAGKFIGVGTWRPANGGEYGRFSGKLVSWKEIS
jgi:hypothetical protein